MGGDRHLCCILRGSMLVDSQGSCTCETQRAHGYVSTVVLGETSSHPNFTTKLVVCTSMSSPIAAVLDTLDMLAMFRSLARKCWRTVFPTCRGRLGLDSGKHPLTGIKLQRVLEPRGCVVAVCDEHFPFVQRGCSAFPCTQQRVITAIFINPIPSHGRYRAVCRRCANHQNAAVEATVKAS